MLKLNGDFNMRTLDNKIARNNERIWRLDMIINQAKEEITELADEPNSADLINELNQELKHMMCNKMRLERKGLTLSAGQ